MSEAGVKAVKQIVAVLDAANECGEFTSADIADVAGLTVRQASHALHVLAIDGLVRRTGRTVPGRFRPYLAWRAALDGG